MVKNKEPVRKRPFGVIVLIVLQVILILGIVADLVMVQRGQPSAIHYLQGFEDTVFFQPLEIATSLYLIGVAIGLWRLQRWAWIIMMIQLGVSMSVNLWLYFNGNPAYLPMLFQVIMVFYLNQTEVQQAFARKRQRQEMTP